MNASHPDFGPHHAPAQHRTFDKAQYWKDMETALAIPRAVPAHWAQWQGRQMGDPDQQAYLLTRIGYAIVLVALAFVFWKVCS